MPVKELKRKNLCSEKLQLMAQNEHNWEGWSVRASSRVQRNDTGQNNCLVYAHFKMAALRHFLHKKMKQFTNITHLCEQRRCCWFPGNWHKVINSSPWCPSFQASSLCSLKMSTSKLSLNASLGLSWSVTQIFRHNASFSGFPRGPPHG